jgi:hypothetical protein
MINKFLTLYSPETPKWDNITHLSSSLGWSELVSQSTSEYLKAQGVSYKFISELVEASTRVNYGQVLFGRFHIRYWAYLELERRRDTCFGGCMFLGSDGSEVRTCDSR